MIQFDAVSKSFTSKRPPALDEVSFEVRQGEIFGLLGHNGAGKSTALGVMLGLVHPDSGEARIDGVSVQQHRVRALKPVGAIFESPRFYEYLSGMQNLRILAGYSNFWDDAQVAETVERVKLTHAIERKVGTYSQGMRQRLALAQALLPRPELLLLDEPTNGLDPDGIVEFRELVRSLRDDMGITVLLNSHLLAEVEQLCDRVVILRQGKKVFDGARSDLDNDGQIIHATLDSWEKAKPVIASQGGEMLGADSFRLPSEKDTSEVVAALVQAGVKVREFRREKASLESLYLTVSKS